MKSGWRDRYLPAREESGETCGFNDQLSTNEDYKETRIG